MSWLGNVLRRLARMHSQKPLVGQKQGMRRRCRTRKTWNEIVERTCYGVDKEHNPKRRIVDKSVTKQTPHRWEEA